MKNVLQLIGQKFGRLKVVKRVENAKAGQSQWLCKCDCGNEIIVKGVSLKCGNTTSCGCYKHECDVNKGKSKKVHGMCNTKLYYVYRAMKSRCNNPKVKEFHYYGGRGIKLCKEWEENFVSFYNWAIQNGYKEGLSIDRIDTNGDYEPTNCRWVSKYVQSNNTRQNRRIEFEGEIHTLAEWARIFDKPYKTIHKRLKDGWNIEKAFKMPVRRN